MDVWNAFERYQDAEDYAYQTWGDSDRTMPFHVVEDFRPNTIHCFLVVRGEVSDECLHDPDGEFSYTRYEIIYTADQHAGTE